ncbi:DUF6264 family protein [Mycobacterium ulcerans]|uniref:DUF6264 family protein n=1 Tax=Mycobacterium ulcerans TaxID=1809 RepID=A0ABY3V919_MYCUL|nr:DUF6264 family protein [Mycobacterium ulcerans]MEB3970264.1 DUF6264 family protein [Mycobacterium ulcerans]MEB3978527.1 DUF6264 family protein [Mycobacterium ulcerans]MEB4007787.1 DUF6264 family protein [Mycobacterium ulcerans]MEB4417388.1 DUF6264 family protein [Mycobacterium ulcerans]MEB4435536.1 DUF6264 family protein [Mycobacterium ulcerans]
MSTDDLAPVHTGGAGSCRAKAHRAVNVTLTIALLVLHAFLFVVTMLVLGLLVMGTDPCGYQTCGDPSWVDKAIGLGFWGGIVIFLADLIISVYRLARHNVAFVVPIIGCVAQLTLGIGAAAMESLAGPV